MATDRKIPSITERAFSVFNKSVNSNPSVSEAIFNSASANVAPSNSKTIETVVEVGIPNELKISSKMMSVTMTAMKIHISS